MGLKGYRLWVMGQLDSTCSAPPRSFSSVRSGTSSPVLKHIWNQEIAKICMRRRSKIYPGYVPGYIWIYLDYYLASWGQLLNCIDLVQPPPPVSCVSTISTGMPSAATAAKMASPRPGSKRKSTLYPSLKRFLRCCSEPRHEKRPPTMMPMRLHSASL